MASEYEELWIDTSEFDRLATELEQFPAAVERRMLEIATGAGATVFQLGMIAKARVRVSERTAGSDSLPAGFVKADVHVEKIRYTMIGHVGWLIGPSTVTGYVWRWLEFGHWLVKGGHLSMKRGKLRGTGHRSVFVPAKPFVRPTFDEYWRLAYDVTCKKLGELMADYLRQGMKRVA